MIQKYFHDRLGFIAIALVFFSSCKKSYVDSISFDVSTSSLIYKVGDTITFNFSGNPENITFYPGTNGYKYANKDRTTATGVSQLQFSSLRQTGVQANSLQLLVSSDFTGIYDSTNVANATWIDVTSRATLSPITGSSTVATPSGIVNLTDFVAKPVYIAYKYFGYAGTAQNKWTITNFSVVNALTDGTNVQLATASDANFIGVDIKNATNKWGINTSQLQFTGGAATAAANEDWAISRPITLNKVKPDVGIALKNVSTYLPAYKVPNLVFSGYAVPGTYTVSFLARNTTAYKEESILKELSITITP